MATDRHQLIDVKLSGNADSGHSSLRDLVLAFPGVSWRRISTLLDNSIGEYVSSTALAEWFADDEEVTAARAAAQAEAANA